MKISVIKKPLGRVRKLQAVDYELQQQPTTLRELLQEIVALEVARYNEVDSLLSFLTTDSGHTGAIKFAPITERARVEVEKSVAIMELAFEDGLFKVLQGTHVYESLDETIATTEPQWTFIKLSFLAGR